EGYLLEPRAATATVRQSNVTQISTRDATVSGSQEASDPAGKNSEMAHQMAMQSKVLKSDMEVIACSRQARNDGTDGGVARLTESIPHQIARAKGRPPGEAFGDAVLVIGTGGTLPTTGTGTWTPTTVSTGQVA